MLLRFVFLLFALPVAALAAGDETLSWVGCGISKQAYVVDLAKKFEEKTGIHIDIEGGGATKGIRKVVSGEADLGGTCRYILPNDPREAGAGLEPIAWDALVMITHKDNPVDSLSIDQLRDIYSGKTTNWKSLGGPDVDIQLFTRAGKHSGVGHTLRKLVFADFEYELTSTREFLSTGPLEQAVSTDPFSLAATGVSSARLRDVKIIKLNGIEPSYDNIKDGSYGLYRPLYLVYNPKSPKIALIRKFISFCHTSEGRNIMKQNGTLPYIDGLPLVMNQIDQDVEAFRRGAKLPLIKY
jgi:phosphate transport system substrate-binding protein